MRVATAVASSSFDTNTSSSMSAQGFITKGRAEAELLPAVFPLSARSLERTLTTEAFIVVGA